MGTEAIPGSKLRVFFFPYITSGHFFPMLNMASLFSSSSSSISCTIITTPSNSHLIPPSLSLLLLPLPSSPLPSGWDSVSSPSSFPHFHTIQSSLSLLHQPLLALLASHRPHCLVSDMFLPWTADVAAELGVPRLVFHGMSAFSLSAIDSIKKHRPQDSVGDDDATTPFTVPGLPRPVSMTRSQLPGPLRARTRFNPVMDQMDESKAKSHGVLVNSFYELEAGFAEHYCSSLGGRAWLVGPVSLCNGDTRYAGEDRHQCLAWLDSKRPDSVLYVCFGSQAEFKASQLSELAAGLVRSEQYFIWVVKEDGWLEKSISENEKALIIKGWAPQVQILNHGSVGGFLTHCGWNSVLEGVSAGKPMITWPVFGDQPFNEKLVVDELGIGVRVGVGIGIGDESEEAETAASVKKGEEIARAVERVMGEGEDAMEMRRKAKKLGEEARAAAKEGGSSWKDMNRLIEDLMSLNKDLII